MGLDSNPPPQSFLSCELRLTPHASRLTPHASRLTPHASRLTPHASRRTPHAVRPPPLVRAAAAPADQPRAAELTERCVWADLRADVPAPPPSPSNHRLPPPRPH